MNRFKFKDIKKIVFGLVILSFIVFITEAYINKGFYYSELNQQIVVDLNESSESFENILNLNNISRIDHKEKTVYFERISQTEVMQNVKEVLSTEEFKDVKISKIQSENKFNAIKETTLFVFSLIIIHFLISLYLQFRKENYKILSKFIKEYLVFTTSIFAIFIYQLGVLFFLSRIYQVRKDDINLILVPVIFGFFIYYKYTFINTENFIDFNESFRLNFVKDLKRVTKTMPLILVPLFFSMGVNFVIPAVVLFIGFVMYFILTRLILSFRAIKTLLNFKSLKENKNSEKEVKNVKKTTKSKKKTFQKNKKKRGR